MCQRRIIVDNMLKYKEKMKRNDNETGDIIINFTEEYLIIRTKYPNFETNDPIVGIK